MPVNRPTDKITIVRPASDQVLAKTVGFDLVEQKKTVTARPNIGLFSVEQGEVDGIESLAQGLEKIQYDPCAAILRDEPRPGIDWERTRRWGPTHKERATFDPVPRRWLVIDFDKVVAPDHVDVTDFNDAVEYLLSLLPSELERATCWAQFTSSAGIKAGISMQLWFWLSRPLGKEEIVAWLAGTGADLGQYDSVKLRFVSRPLFSKNAIDSIPYRSGIWGGEDDTVEVPEIHVSKTKKPKRRSSAARPRRTGDLATPVGAPGAGLRSTPGYERHKARIAPGERHRNTVSAVAAYIAVNGTHGTDTEALARDLLAQTFTAYGDEADKATVEEWRAEIDDTINWTLERQAETEPGAVQLDAEPHFPAPTGTLEDAERQLRDTVAAVLERGERRGLRAPAGLGKSQAVIDAIKRRVENAGGDNGRLPIWYFVPTIALARELAERFHQDAPEVCVRLVKGRAAGLEPGREADGPPPCRKAPLANYLGKLGFPIKPLLCERIKECCEHRKTCDYFAQFKRGADVYIMPHAYLTLGWADVNPTLDEMPRPSAIVIDESFIDTAIGATWIALPDLTHGVTPEVVEKPGDIFVDDALRLLAVTAMTSGRPILDCLTEAGVNADALKRFADADASEDMLPHITPGAPLWLQERQVEALPVDNQARARAEVWRLLSEEMEAGLTGDSRRVRLEMRDGAAGVAATCRRTIKLPDIDTIPLLLIDADLEPAIVSRFFADVQCGEILVERQAYAVQVVDKTGSKTQVLRAGDGPGRVFDDIVAAIEAECYRRTVLVVATKTIIDELRGHPWLATIPTTRLDFAHFGALRGIDRWKGHESVIVVGREQPPSGSIEDIADALWWDDGEPIERVTGPLPTTERGIRMRGGGAVMIEANVHPDYRAQLVLEQVRERQDVQGIDRLRLIRAEPAKHVLVIGSLPLDLTVDQAVHMSEIVPSKAERILMRTGGVLPLSPTSLADLAPDIFGDGKRETAVRAAKDWLLREFDPNGCIRYIGYNIANAPITAASAGMWDAPRNIREYRCRARRDGTTREAPVVVFAASPIDARLKAEAALGKLAVFGIDWGETERCDEVWLSGLAPPPDAPLAMMSREAIIAAFAATPIPPMCIGGLRPVHVEISR
jgi:hypothetical protein